MPDTDPTTVTSLTRIIRDRDDDRNTNVTT